MKKIWTIQIVAILIVISSGPLCVVYFQMDTFTVLAIQAAVLAVVCHLAFKARLRFIRQLYLDDMRRHGLPEKFIAGIEKHLKR